MQVHAPHPPTCMQPCNQHVTHPWSRQTRAPAARATGDPSAPACMAPMHAALPLAPQARGLLHAAHRGRMACRSHAHACGQQAAQAPTTVSRPYKSLVWSGVTGSSGPARLLPRCLRTEWSGGSLHAPGGACAARAPLEPAHGRHGGKGRGSSRAAAPVVKGQDLVALGGQDVCQLVIVAQQAKGAWLARGLGTARTSKGGRRAQKQCVGGARAGIQGRLAGVGGRMCCVLLPQHAAQAGGDSTPRQVRRGRGQHAATVLPHRSGGRPCRPRPGPAAHSRAAHQRRWAPCRSGLAALPRRGGPCLLLLRHQRDARWRGCGRARGLSKMLAAARQNRYAGMRYQGLLGGCVRVTASLRARTVAAQSSPNGCELHCNASSSKTHNISRVAGNASAPVFGAARRAALRACHAAWTARAPPEAGRSYTPGTSSRYEPPLARHAASPVFSQHAHCHPGHGTA